MIVNVKSCNTKRETITPKNIYNIHFILYTRSLYSRYLSRFKYSSLDSTSINYRKSDFFQNYL